MAGYRSPAPSGDYLGIPAQERLSEPQIKNEALHFFHRLRQASIQRQQEMDPNGTIDLAFRGLELGGEVGELQNCLKKLERERRGLRGSRTTREATLEELADAYICLDLIAMDLNVPVEEVQRAIAAKFNKTSESWRVPTRLA